MFKKGILPKGQPMRKELVWTPKAKILWLVAMVIYHAVAILIGWVLYKQAHLSGGLAVLIILALTYLFAVAFFVFLTITAWLLFPVDWMMKKNVINRAKRKIADLPNLKIIAIAGSYGKTSMKEVLKEVLSVKYKVLSTPESVNTPVGIARWILQKFDQTLEVAVVEMGEHYRGDIKFLCQITRPDVVVVTGINEAHLERLKNLDATIATIFEAAENAKDKSLLVMNADDKNILNNYKKYSGNKKLAFYGKLNNALTNFQISDFSFDQEGKGIKFNMQEAGQPLGEFCMSLLGQYGAGLAMAAAVVGSRLGLSMEQIKEGLKNVKPIEHRLQPIFSTNNLLVIDDSYNGNPDGVREAINVLSQFKERRKVYITPGLVETGEKAGEIHREIGKQLATVADVIILVKNSVTPWIELGVRDAVIASPNASDPFDFTQGQPEQSRMAEGAAISSKKKIASPFAKASDFAKATSDKSEDRSDALVMTRGPEILWYNSAQEAHDNLKNILKPNDVILFQNDWGDQYI